MKPSLRIVLATFLFVSAASAINAQDNNGIDLNATELRDGFAGHNINAIYAELLTRFSEKGEFESTAQYVSRLQRAKATPLLGKWSMNGMLAFEVQATPSEATYDADKQEMIVAVPFEGYHVPEGARIIVVAKSSEEDKYEGGNAMGARTIVTRIKQTRWGITFTDISSRPFVQSYSSPIVDSKSAILFVVSMNSITAQRIKSGLRVMLIVRLIDPFVLEDDYFSLGPTFSRPTEFDITSHFLSAELIDAWLCDTTTGTILAKKANGKRGL